MLAFAAPHSPDQIADVTLVTALEGNMVMVGG